MHTLLLGQDKLPPRIAYRVQSTESPIDNYPFCRIATTKTKAFAGAYTMRRNNWPYGGAPSWVYWTGDGLNWNRSALNPGTCESSHTIMAWPSKDGVHVGMEQCGTATRVWDMVDDDPNYGNLFIKESDLQTGLKYALAMGGGDTPSFNEVIAVSSDYNLLDSQLWWYDNGWKPAPYPRPFDPDSGNAVLVWSITEFKDNLVLGCSWTQGRYHDPFAGLLLTWKKGDPNYFQKPFDPIKGWCKAMKVMNGRLYMAFGGMVYWTDDLVNFHEIPIPNNHGIACARLVAIDGRRLVGIWYTRGPWSPDYERAVHGEWPIGAWIHEIDTYNNTMREIHDFGFRTDTDLTPYGVGGGLDLLTNGILVGFVNKGDDKAYGVRVHYWLQK